jgi:hypothetical protein
MNGCHENSKSRAGDWHGASNCHLRQPTNTNNPPNGATMTKTIKTARPTHTAKTGSEVQSMLLDIATVLRLTAMVKAEMIRDRAEADRKHIETRRTVRHTQLSLA